jgi:hypothetical protein
VILLVLLAATVHDATQVEDAQPAAEETQAGSDDPAPKDPGAKKNQHQQANKAKGELAKGTATPPAAAGEKPADDEPGQAAREPRVPVNRNPGREPQGGRTGSTGDRNAGVGGGDTLAGEDPPTVTDPPDDPPVVSDPPDDPPLVTDPPADPPDDPPVRPTCGVAGTPPCPRNPPGGTQPPRQPPPVP